MFVSVPLKFNSTTATALSRGTCDCASDLGRGTPSYSRCFLPPTSPTPFPVFPSQLPVWSDSAPSPLAAYPIPLPTCARHPPE